MGKDHLSSAGTLVSDRPEIELHEHPLQRVNFRIPTPPIETLLNFILDAADLRLTGVMATGPQRIGKTAGIDVVEPLLRQHFDGNLPVLRHEMVNPHVSEVRFYEELCRSCGLDGSSAGRKRRTAQEWLHLIVQHLVALAMDHGDERVLLFIDEANLLKENDYGLLMDIHNRMSRHSVLLMTILVGQPELLQVRASLRGFGKYQIVERFMARVHEFTGLRSAADVATVMRQLDARYCFPEGSDWTFTRFHVPIAYAEGFRLEHYASRIWESYVEHYPGSSGRQGGQRKGFEIPMPAFCRLCKVILRELHAQDSTGLELEAGLIKEALMGTYTYVESDD